MPELGIDRISPSMLMEFEKCPRLFFYRSWLGLQLPQQMVHLNFGTAIHLAIDNIYEQYDDLGDDPQGWKLAEFKIPKDIFLREFTLDKLDRESYATEEDRVRTWETMREDGVKMLKDLWDQKEDLKDLGVFPKEFEIKARLVLTNPKTGEPLPIPMSCRLDARCPQRITEFKTSTARYDPHETRQSAQSLSYVWVDYCQTGNLKPVDYVVLLKKKAKDRVQHLHFEYTMEDLLAFDSRVRAILERIRLRQFKLTEPCTQYFCDCGKFYKVLNENR